MFPIYKAKIVDSYLDSQFLAAGFKMLCKDRAKIRGGVLLFLNENLPGKILNTYKFR